MMKDRTIAILISSFFLFSTQGLLANSRITYAEEWYNLYHLHLHRYPEEEFANLIYLERALQADFSNPRYALAIIETADEWQLYRYLFKMHVNLQLVRTYMALASKYDRQHVYFYNQPWKEQNLRSLDIAEKYYQRAYFFWDEALNWVEVIHSEKGLRWIHLGDINHWHNEFTYIQEGKLDFQKILNRHMKRLESNRQKFLEMDETTY
ncbi:hypothetical protein PVA44_02550 [Entomospira nematocerorum]|uniref:Uncharacterized protein n=1 Tax=Entomospira nematocerorum TaxID=2719987 RepID=A0A968KT59_9SPIO|nr:hypothetical protein [Entomospira nematocera]NIZ47086.1 hypothetical protein [Entomospira nematocera]WDI34369.1 hypothetical protein PVA44_02550 [Entomospira nematocera]